MLHTDLDRVSIEREKSGCVRGGDLAGAECRVSAGANAQSAQMREQSAHMHRARKGQRAHMRRVRKGQRAQMRRVRRSRVRK